MKINVSTISKIAKKTQKSVKNIYFSQTGKSDWPSTIFLSINSICNSKCKMCDVGQGIKDSQFYKNLRIDGKKPVELKLSRLKKLIDEVKHFKPVISVISTEPLLYQDLFKFAKYVRKAGLEIAVTTNGILLKKFAKDFVEADINNIWVSIDGPARTHNFVRGVPQIFQKATGGIKEIEKWKKKLGKVNPKLNINYTISNYNFDKLNEFMETIMPLNPVMITFGHYNYVTPDMAREHNEKYKDVVKVTASCVSAVDLKKIDPQILLKQINQVKKKWGKKVILGFSPDMTSLKQVEDFYQNPHVIIAKRACAAPWTVAQILADGSLTISTRCFNMNLGNINKTSFAEAWNSPEFCKFRKMIKKQGMFVPACTRCCAVL